MFETYYSILLLILILPLSFILSFLHYRKVKLTGVKKNLLIFLRFFSLLLIMFLFLFPVIKFIEQSKKDNVELILIDNSLSLKIQSRDSILKEKVKEFINVLEKNNRKYDIYLFSRSLMKKISKDEIELIKYDSIDNFKTNLDVSIKEILDNEKDNKISSINIFSDGIVNEGYDLLSSSGINVKINFFLIGETEQKPDLVIKEVLYNKYSYILQKSR